MILTLELLAFNNGQISLLQVMYALVENLGNVGATELSIETVLVYLIIAHILIFDVVVLKSKRPIARTTGLFISFT
jgi:hypothetical protein